MMHGTINMRNFFFLPQVDLILSSDRAYPTFCSFGTQGKGGRILKFTIHFIFCQDWEWIYKSTPPYHFMAWLGNFTAPKRIAFPTKRYKWLGKIVVWAGFYAEHLDSRRLSFWWLAVGICCAVSRNRQRREARTTVFCTPSQQPAGSPAILRIPIS